MPACTCTFYHAPGNIGILEFWNSAWVPACLHLEEGNFVSGSSRFSHHTPGLGPGYLGCCSLPLGLLGSPPHWEVGFSCWEEPACLGSCLPGWKGSPATSPAPATPGGFSAFLLFSYSRLEHFTANFCTPASPPLWVSGNSRSPGCRFSHLPGGGRSCRWNSTWVISGVGGFRPGRPPFHSGSALHTHSHSGAGMPISPFLGVPGGRGSPAIPALIQMPTTCISTIPCDFLHLPGRPTFSTILS